MKAVTMLQKRLRSVRHDPAFKTACYFHTQGEMLRREAGLRKTPDTDRKMYDALWLAAYRHGLANHDMSWIKEGSK